MENAMANTETMGTVPALAVQPLCAL